MIRFSLNEVLYLIVLRIVKTLHCNTGLRSTVIHLYTFARCLWNRFNYLRVHRITAGKSGLTSTLDTVIWFAIRIPYSAKLFFIVILSPHIWAERLDVPDNPYCSRNNVNFDFNLIHRPNVFIQVHIVRSLKYPNTNERIQCLYIQCVYIHTFC